jgi:hypothetical protein
MKTQYSNLDTLDKEFVTAISNSLMTALLLNLVRHLSGNDENIKKVVTNTINLWEDDILKNIKPEISDGHVEILKKNFVKDLTKEIKDIVRVDLGLL